MAHQPWRSTRNDAETRAWPSRVPAARHARGAPIVRKNTVRLAGRHRASRPRRPSVGVPRGARARGRMRARARHGDRHRRRRRRVRRPRAVRRRQRDRAPRVHPNPDVQIDGDLVRDRVKARDRAAPPLRRPRQARLRAPRSTRESRRPARHRRRALRRLPRRPAVHGGRREPARRALRRADGGARRRRRSTSSAAIARSAARRRARPRPSSSAARRARRDRGQRGRSEVRRRRHRAAVDRPVRRSARGPPRRPPLGEGSPRAEPVLVHRRDLASTRMPAGPPRSSPSTSPQRRTRARAGTSRRRGFDPEKPEHIVGDAFKVLARFVERGRDVRHGRARSAGVRERGGARWQAVERDARLRRAVAAASRCSRRAACWSPRRRRTRCRRTSSSARSPTARSSAGHAAADHRSPVAAARLPDAARLPRGRTTSSSRSRSAAERGQRHVGRRHCVGRARQRQQRLDLEARRLALALADCRGVAQRRARARRARAARSPGSTQTFVDELDDRGDRQRERPTPSARSARSIADHGVAAIALRRLLHERGDRVLDLHDVIERCGRGVVGSRAIAPSRSPRRCAA